MINSCVDFTLCILSSFWPSRCSHINRKRLSCGRRDKSVVLYLFSSFHKFHQQTLTNTTIVLLTRLLFATLSPLAVTERTVFKSISRAHSSRLSHFLQSHTLWFNQGRRESGEYGISWKRCVFDCFLVCRVTGKPSLWCMWRKKRRCYILLKCCFLAVTCTCTVFTALPLQMCERGHLLQTRAVFCSCAIWVSNCNFFCCELEPSFWISGHVT